MREKLRPEHLQARLLRALSGKTQSRIGEEIGVYPSHVDQWEQGSSTPGEEDLDRLAASAGLAPEDADEHLRLYEMQRKTRQRRSEGTGVILDELAERLGRHCALAVRRLLKLEVPRPAPSPEDRLRAEEQFAKLKRLSTRSKLVVVRTAESFQTWSLCERCCDESAREASRNLKRAAGWAKVALEISNRIRGPKGWRLRLRGYALAHWANILRVRGELKVAERRIEDARRLWLAGSDPAGLLDPGRLFDLEGSLRRAQRRFGEALRLFDQAFAASRFPERALIKKAFTLEVMGDYEHAIATLRRAEPLVERRGDPRLIYAQRFNLAVNLCHVGHFSEASALLEQARCLAAALGDKIIGYRVCWLAGRIAAGLGRPAEALELLGEARRKFADEKMSYDVALALLEEAVLLLQEGRTAEVKALTRELAGVFESKGVHREALAALRLFQEAAEREAATAELARRILRYLFRARHDEGLRFEL